MPVVKVTIAEAITVEAGLAIVGMVVLEAVLGRVFVFNIFSQSPQIFSREIDTKLKRTWGMRNILDNFGFPIGKI